MMLWNKRSKILPLRIDIFVDYDHVNVWVCFLNDSLFNHKVSCCHVVWHAIILHYTRVHDVKDIHDLYKHVTLIVEGQYKTIISISCQQATLDESTKILHTLFSKAHMISHTMTQGQKIRLINRFSKILSANLSWTGVTITGAVLTPPPTTTVVLECEECMPGACTCWGGGAYPCWCALYTCWGGCGKYPCGCGPYPWGGVA